MEKESHFTNKDREVLHDVKDTVHTIPPDVADYISNRLNEFTLQLSEHLAQTVHGAVKETVNGKINDFRKEFNLYVEGDMKWKERANPAVDFFVNVTWSKKFFLGVIAFVATILSFILLVKAIFISK